MVLTAAQTQSFFENANQMAIPHATVVELQNEGIDTVDDLSEFDKDQLDQIAQNLRRPAGGAEAFTFGAKSQKRLLAATQLVKYYNTVGRNLTAANLQWFPIMKNFSEQWTSLEERKEEDDPETPTISKELPIMKWVEAFEDHLERCIGVRCVPLSYVVRDEVIPPPITPLAPNQAYTLTHGSLESDLVARASHDHGLFRADNKAVYFKIEEATRTTQYAASIKTFQRGKDGRAAFEALKKQYAGVDKWESTLKQMDTLLHTRKWRGQNQYTLEKFCQHHRNAYVQMQSCSAHVEYQLPNEHTRVGYLLDAIENTDAKLLAAIANINDDKGDGTPANPGKRNDFEAAVAYLLPNDPVDRKKKGAGKRTGAEISSTEVGSFGSKKGIGMTGVHLRWHKPSEFKKLSEEQKEELFQWRKNKGKDKAEKNSKKKVKIYEEETDVSALISKQLDEKLAEMSNKRKEEDRNDQEAKAYIMSLFQETDPKSENKIIASTITSDTSSKTVKKIDLKSILKRAKNA